MDLSQLLRALGLQQAYQSYQENVGQPFANLAGPFGRGLLGLEKPKYGEEQAYRTGQAVGNMPAVSAPVGAFKAAAQVPGLLADATQAMKGLDLAGLLGLTAYHGSPYRFSKFDPTKIGSGEGAQVYGYGHYFAENPSVAGQYKMSTAVDKYETSAGPFRSSDLVEALVANSGQVQPQLQSAYMAKANEVVRDLIMGSSANEIAKAIRDSKYARTYAGLADAVEKLSPAKATGKMYTVDIPDEMIGRMLDWDKPIGQQSETIQRLAKQVGLEMDDLGGDLVARFNAKRPEGAMLLREQGIPGIRYYDQASRTKDGGTRNFVVFPGEEEAIKMLKVE